MSQKKIPMRKCLGCKQMTAKNQLMRVLRCADTQVIIDNAGKKSGRGAYVCKNIDCLNKVIKSQAFKRALGVAIPEKIYEDLKKEMEGNIGR